MTPNRKKQKTASGLTATQRAPTAPLDAGRTLHAPFLGDDSPDALEHGERPPGQAREDALLGTSSTHSRQPDSRAEEPYGEIGASALAEGSHD